jgi:3-ketosteroid 9alpha-monooxygenase subunit A
MQTAVALGDFVKMGFEQDVAIWRNKARIDNPLLVEEDGPVYQLRRWYEQFYVNAAEVTSDMVDRFEFEIDTTRPREQWMAEVEANLAAKAARTAQVTGASAPS